MAVTNGGFLIPAALTILFAMFATPTMASRSNLLSSLYNKASDKKPLVLVLDSPVLTKGLDSNRLDTDLLDLGQHNKKTVPYVYLLNQLAQSRNRDNSKFRKPVRSRQRYRAERHQSRNRHNRHSRPDEDRYNRDRNRDSSSTDDDSDEYHSRGRYQRQKYRYRSNIHLRTDDKGDQEQDREDKNVQPSQNAPEESAQAQIPVIKSLLRSLNCNAKDECQDTCGEINNKKKKNACENKCEEKFECEPETEEDNQCGNSCETTPSCQAGSTKGPPPEPTQKTCNRC